MLTEDELKAIEARANAATPGPWTCDRSTWVISGERFAVASVEVGDDATVSFVCSARSDVPALLAEVRRLQAALAEAEAMNKAYFEAGHAVARARVAIPIEAVRASRETAK